MSVVVHQLLHSPYCIPITAALRACGVEFSTRDVSNADRSELLRLTGGAYYQVPVLDHDGRLVFESGGDSLDVARYVDATFAGGRFFPVEIEGPHRCTIEFIEDAVEFRTFRLIDPQVLDAMADPAERGMIVRHKERKFGRGCVEQWRRDAVSIRAELDALLTRFETTLRARPFLFGDAPVYADFALLGVLGNLTFNGWNSLHEESQRALRDFTARLAAWRVCDCR